MVGQIVCRLGTRPADTLPRPGRVDPRSRCDAIRLGVASLADAIVADASAAEYLQLHLGVGNERCPPAKQTSRSAGFSPMSRNARPTKWLFEMKLRKLLLHREAGCVIGFWQDLVASNHSNRMYDTPGAIWWHRGDDSAGAMGISSLG